MNMDKVKILLHAIDSGSFTETAAAFDYTPSGISHMMSSLEAEVGFPLLVRSKSGITPTENAKRLIPIIRAQCEWDEQFLRTISEIKGLTQGTLRIGAAVGIARQWLPPVLARFSRDYPGIRIELLEGTWQEVNKYLQNNLADLVMYGYQPGIRHQWIPLRNDPMVVAVPLHHPLASRASIRMQDLRGECFILPAAGSDIDVVRLLKEEQIAAERRFSTRQNDSALGLVEEGMGVLITSELSAGGLSARVKLLPFNPPRSIPLGIAVPVENRKSPPVSRFISYAVEMLQEK